MDWLKLAKDNAKKAKQKAKDNVKLNNIVDTKRLASIANKEFVKIEKEKEKDYLALVERSNKNFKICRKTPGLVGKVDYIVFANEEQTLMKNKITKQISTLAQGVWIFMDVM